VTIHGGEFVMKDAVVLERFLDSLAEREGVSPTAYRERLATTAKAILGSGSDGTENDLSAAVVRLINEPRKHAAHFDGARDTRQPRGTQESP